MASKPEWGWHGAVAEFFSSFVLWSRCELRSRRMRNDRERPNKRLKLPGGERYKGSGVLAPWRARTLVQVSCAGGRVARSLSAIR